ncbi:MAG: SoxR reducing system RseC family protein, partial [Oscillospiraceae bacterium]|nr:SoxR reducing system RseC family protein [Oscillospiraceae bacterium]
GDAVLIESKNSYVYKAAFLVYVIPIVLMILMYALGSLVFKSEGISIVCAFLGIILGGIVIVLTERRRKTAIDFSIVDFNEEKKFNG